MRKFFTTIKRIFTIPELRSRILTTLGLLLIFRLGAFIVLPGIDATKITGKAQGILGLLDIFLGGAFSNVSIFGLGVMPYISASIAVQLLTVAVPYFQKIQREGQSGRKTLNKITKILTIGIAMVQSASYLAATVSDELIMISKPLFFISSLFVLPAGTMACIWIGDRITDKGIGNGVSMLIMIGIVSSLPGAFVEEFILRGSRGLLIFIFEVFALFLIVVTVVMFTQAIRKIPLQYAKQMATTGAYTGQRQYIPLKLNTSGVMPIIFAQVLMFLPALVTNLFAGKSDTMAAISKIFGDFTTWQYNLVFSLLIIAFTYFYTAITINPMQIADDMKRSSSFIPGIKPGKLTAAFIDDILSKITLPGSLFLAIIAILPGLAYIAGLSKSFSRFFGGTSLLIMVGVVLDSLQQIESFLLMHHYDHMMDSGRIQGRSQT
ncbi:MAG: preprotein translocase subunit SecY [Candidatus Amoebophilus sp. 36-38]|nr:MAG: preprotein translocase subunit SecY [Candidatus Amoebophilus sp. 36-38]